MNDMKMDHTKMRNLLEERLKKDNRSFQYHREESTLRIVNTDTNKGITISLPPLIAKWEEKGEKAIEDVIYYVDQGLEVLEEPLSVEGYEKRIFPVIRSTSFPTEHNGVSLVYDDHTAETRIYYALDLGKTYRLIDESLLKKEGWDKKQLKEIALFNVRSLPMKVKEDVVSDNTFYFINHNDGYDASRILNDAFLKEMAEKVKGDMVVAVPHQDVLIIADVVNNRGYDVIAQLTMSFFTSGTVPITALSFIYEKGKLEPIFILGKNR